MHLTYETELFSKELMQGDVLKRTPAFNALLQEVHPHFFHHPKNLYFMVLTQTCDLVPRNPDGICKAPYIAIAPVRALDLVIERSLEQQAVADVRAELPVLNQKARNKSSEFLVRLFNNNEPGYFYLDAADTPLPVDCVAFLSLSIAIKADLHYAKCVEAKILQLTDTFQAKLGWLVGQLFSRVGTPDWEPSQLSKKVAAVLKDAAIWVEDGKIEALEAAYRQFAPDEAGRKMTSDEIGAVVARIPTRKQRVLGRAGAVIMDYLKDDPRAQKLIKRLEGDAALTALLK
jgi:hypothetical protein